MNKILQKIISFGIGVVVLIGGVFVKRSRLTKWIMIPLLIISILIGGFFISRTFLEEPLAFAAVSHGSTQTGSVSSGDSITVSSLVVTGSDTIIVCNKTKINWL